MRLRDNLRTTHDTRLVVVHQHTQRGQRFAHGQILESYACRPAQIFVCSSGNDQLNTRTVRRTRTRHRSDDQNFEPQALHLVVGRKRRRAYNSIRDANITKMRTMTSAPRLLWPLMVSLLLQARQAHGLWGGLKHAFGEFGATGATPPSLRWKNLVFEGGGARGISYIGALKALAQHGYYAESEDEPLATYKFERVAGTSVGCLFGLAVALDVPPQKLERLVLPSSTKSITLEAVLGARADMLGKSVPRLGSSRTFVAYVRHAWRYTKYLLRLVLYWRDDESPGLVNSAPMMRWLSRQLLPLSPYSSDRRRFGGANLSLDTTLGELHALTGHRLTCFATRLVHNSVARFSVEETPNAALRHVLYSSMALPGVFKPACDKTLGCPLVDGGVLNNFPIYEYDDCDAETSTQTLGLSLHGTLQAYRDKCQIRADEHQQRYTRARNAASLAHSRISTPGYVAALLDVLANVKSFAAYATDPRNAERVVYLDSRLKTLERNLNVANIREAIDSGYARTHEFLRQASRHR